MKNDTFRTKHFNIVMNSKHGACLLFDRKGLGIYQPQASRVRIFPVRKFSTGVLNKIFHSLWDQVKNIIYAQKWHLPLCSRQAQ